MYNKEILKNGPEGWTHVSNGPSYYRKANGIQELYFGANSGWQRTSINALTRSRVDIERIVEIEDALAYCASANTKIQVENTVKEILSK